MAGDTPLTESDTSSDEGEWQDVDQGDGGDEESLAVVSLLDDRVFPDAISMLSYCKNSHHFDFLAARDRLSLDFHGSVKLINFIRQSVLDGGRIPEHIEMEHFNDDRFLKLVLTDDALILNLDDLPAPQEQPHPQPGHSVAHSSDQTPDLLQKNAALEAELQSLTKQFTTYRLAVQETLDRRWGSEGDEEEPVSSGTAGGRQETGKGDSDYYWESYAHNDIHETMLKDTVRTDAYRDFIYGNKHLFAGKIVLDIGCGTGILSMFCAKAGARQVIAVDKSAIIDKARENVFRNGLGEKIMCLRGMIEDVTLPVDKVDVIVSEWMGYCLLYEAMLPSVIWARDRYLKPDGLLVPSHASMWIAPVSDSEYVSDNVEFWRNVYGFDMLAMQADIYSDVRVQTMPESSVCGSPYCFRMLDLYVTKTSDLTFDAAWTSKLSSKPDAVDGFLVWFDIFFASSRADAVAWHSSAQEWAAGGGERVAFTTGPMGPETHWRQGLLLNSRQPTTERPEGEAGLDGSIGYSVPDGNARGLSLRVTWGSAPGNKTTKLWQLR